MLAFPSFYLTLMCLAWQQKASYLGQFQSLDWALFFLHVLSEGKSMGQLLANHAYKALQKVVVSHCAQ